MNAETTMPNATIRLPEPPAELWMLWGVDEDNGEGYWVRSIDDAPGGDTALVAFTEAEAIRAAKYQEDLYGLGKVWPIRVK